MTGMEQSLRYIEREIRFMIRDQYGNATYVKYADRVIEDACGIPNFCTTVLSSKKPLSIILRAIRGPRGDIIMRFFNASLHDARIEMVMVLVEAIKLRIHKNRSSRDAYEYLMKLYRKAIKRTIRLITGSKNKESYKSMYRSLRDFANMDDYDYDDDDEDDYFDSDTEFGDSEFADTCLNAYRNGEIPPEMKRNKPSFINPLQHAIEKGGNEEILKEISAIESKLGRHLTDSELDELLCGDDDEDDVESIYPKTPASLFRKESDDMIDSITEIIYKRLLKKLNGEPIEKGPLFANYGTLNKYESLDEFIDKEEAKKEVVIPDIDTTPTTKVPENKSKKKENKPKPSVQKDTSLESLVEMQEGIFAGASNVVLKVKEGSYAQSYAEQYGVNYEFY